jgi:hypothetical protein
MDLLGALLLVVPRLRLVEIKRTGRIGYVRLQAEAENRLARLPALSGVLCVWPVCIRPWDIESSHCHHSAFRSRPSARLLCASGDAQKARWTLAAAPNMLIRAVQRAFVLRRRQSDSQAALVIMFACSPAAFPKDFSTAFFAMPMQAGYRALEGDQHEIEALQLARDVASDDVTIDLISLESLPELPRPVLKEMRSEAACGIFTVLTIILLFVLLAHGTLGNTANVAPELRAAWLGSIYGLAVFAVSFLLALIFGDPGTVKRSEETCFPLPAEVSRKIAAGESLAGMSNIQHDDQAVLLTFCTRCLVWRPRDAHHCSTCQRCVVNFDHHCGFFGRCIAGKFTFRPLEGCLVSGNYPWFILIIATGQLAFMVRSFSVLRGVGALVARCGHACGVAGKLYVPHFSLHEKLSRGRSDD